MAAALNAFMKIGSAEGESKQGESSAGDGQYKGWIELQAWDARELPMADKTVDTLVADLPFGQLMGSHEENEELYPKILAEAARVARPGGHFVAITQQVNLFERCLQRGADRWSCERTLRLELPTNAGLLKPRIYVLRRSDMT